jgi:hypothetical protein
MTKTTKPTPVDAIRDDAARRKLPALCAEYRDLKDAISELSKAADGIKSEINDHAKRARVVKVDGDGWRLSKMKGRVTLSKTRLLEEGVSVEVIERATVEGKPYYQVVKIK